MTRKELYCEIKNLGLQEHVRTKYGVNYTNCSNEQLTLIIRKAKDSNSLEEKKVAKKSECGSINKFKMLVSILKERHLLLQSDVEKIMNA